MICMCMYCRHILWPAFIIEVIYCIKLLLNICIAIANDPKFRIRALDSWGTCYSMIGFLYFTQNTMWHSMQSTKIEHVTVTMHFAFRMQDWIWSYSVSFILSLIPCHMWNKSKPLSEQHKRGALHLLGFSWVKAQIWTLFHFLQFE